MKRIIAFIMALLLTLSTLAGAALTITVNATEFRPIIQVTDVSEKEIHIGGTETLSIELTNVGKKYARDLNFKIVIPEGSPIISKSLIQNGFATSLNPDKSESFAFDFGVDSNAGEGVYPIQIQGAYYDKDAIEYTLDETVYISLVKDKKRARLALDYDSNEMLYADANYTKTFELTNVGSKVIDFVGIRLDPKQDTGIKAVSTDPVYLETMYGGNSRSFDYDFYVPSGVTGYQKAKFLISYVEDEILKEEPISFYYNVKEQEQNIVVSKVSMSHESVVSDSRFSMTAVIVNVSEKDAKDIRVNVVQGSSITTVSDSYFLIDMLKAGDTKEVTFDFKGIRDIPTANYPINVEVVYDDGNKKVEASGGIYIKNIKTENQSAPRMSVDAFAVDKDQVFVGNDFTVDMTIRNTSTEKSVKNLKVIVDATDAAGSTTALIPVGTSNSAFVGTLGKGETAEVTIPYKILANAKGGMYSLNVRFEYEDKDHQAFKDSELLNLPVYEKNKLTLSDVRVGNVLDSAYTLQLDFYNTGKIDIHNMMVDIEGEFEAFNSNYYVGDFLSGRMDVYEVQLKGSLPEKINGTITFTYDDTFGESVNMEKEFEIINEQAETTGMEGDLGDGVVMAQGLNENNPEDGMALTLEPGMNITLIGGIVAGLVIIGGIIVLVIKKRKQVD